MMDGLDFLHNNGMASEKAYLLRNISEVERLKDQLDSFADYFNSTYVADSYHHIQPPGGSDGAFHQFK